MVHPTVKAGRRRAAAGADAGLLDGRRAAAAVPAHGGACGPGARRARRDASARPDDRPHGAWDLREALSFLHYPPPDVALATLEDRSHPAWQRLKAEELLAQQLSQLQARRARAAQRAPALGGACRRRCTSELLAALPFAADRRAAARRRGDRARPGARGPDAPPAAGRRGLRQDGGGGAGRRALHRRRLPVRADGADRDPGRAAFPQAGRLARAAAGRARPARGLAHRQPEEEGARRDAGRWSRAARPRW